jgi:hypothetical protein
VSRFIVVLCAVALFAPAAQAQTAITAVVKFSPAVPRSQRVTTVRSAGGRVLKLRGTRVVARMPVRAAGSLRSAMGVIAVRY